LARSPAPAPEPAREAEPDDEARTLTSVQERPLPPRRVPAARRPPPRRPLQAPRARRPGSWRRRIGALLAFVLLAAAVYLIHGAFQPFHGAGTGRVSITIPAGADVGEIGTLLQRRGVIENATFFQLNATVTGRRG